MANDFGALTDHFGILTIVNGAGTLDDVFELVASSKTPIALSRGDATDENGDIAASTWYGQTTEADLYEASSTFAMKSGTMEVDVLQLGELVAGSVVTGIEISTGSDGWPQFTFNGTLGAETIVAPTACTNKFTMPDGLTVLGVRRAQLLGFTIDEGCRLTGSSLSASVDLASQADGLGEPVAHGVSGGVMTGTAELVGITAAPAWTVTLADASETQVPGADEGQAAYHTGSGAYEIILTRDASA